MSTFIDSNTKKLMIAKKQKELSMLMAEQEANRPKTKLRKLKAKGGITVPGKRIDQNILPYEGPVDPFSLVQEQPEYNPWDLTNVTGPYVAGNPTQTPESGLTFGDKLQVYGKQALDKDNWNDYAAIAPVVSNMIGGMRKAEQINARDYYNPNRNQVASLMRDRRVNVQPQLDAILDTESTANYNLRNFSNSRGESMANRTALSNVAGRNRSAVLAGKQNQDLGYMGEEAGMLAGLGQQEAQANWNTMDWNMQSLANKRNMWRAGLSQLSQYGQMKELMGNQKLQDENKTNIYKDMFGSISPFLQFMKNFQLSSV